MSADVESALFSSVDGKGWHGLGLAIPDNAARDPCKMAELLNAMWTVQAKPVYYKNAKGEFCAIENTAAQVRSDTGAVLSVTSENRYFTENRQPIDYLEAFRDALKKENLMISHAAILRGGKIVTVSARLPDADFGVGAGKKKDMIKVFTSLSGGYDKQHGSKCVFNGIREVCSNTHEFNVADAIKDGRLRTIKASQKLEETSLHDLLHGKIGIIEEEKRKYNALANAKMSEAQVTKFFADVLQINIEDLGKVNKNQEKLVSTKSENMLKALANAYKNAPGASIANGTAWGAFNAVTYYATHEKTCRDTMSDGAVNARVASNMFGDSARLKARALSYALQKVAA